MRITPGGAQRTVRSGCAGKKLHRTHVESLGTGQSWKPGARKKLCRTAHMTLRNETPVRGQQNALHSSSVNTPRAQWTLVHSTSCFARIGIENRQLRWQRPPFYTPIINHLASNGPHTRNSASKNPVNDQLDERIVADVKSWPSRVTTWGIAGSEDGRPAEHPCFGTQSLLACGTRAFIRPTFLNQPSTNGDFPHPQVKTKL